MQSPSHITQFGPWHCAGLILALAAPGAVLAQQRPFIGTFMHTQQDTSTEMENLMDNPYLAGVTTKLAWEGLEKDFDGVTSKRGPITSPSSEQKPPPATDYLAPVRRGETWLPARATSFQPNLE